MFQIMGGVRALPHAFIRSAMFQIMGGVRALPHAFIQSAIVPKQTECNRGHSDEHLSIFFIFLVDLEKKLFKSEN